MNNIEDYCIKYSKKESQIVSEIKKFTFQSEEAPQMISGEIVGNLLKSLSDFNDRQIFVITHLPQVAAKSKYHFRVSKNTIAKETKSNIEYLEIEERIHEIARMLGGLDITATTLEHAKEILAN